MTTRRQPRQPRRIIGEHFRPDGRPKIPYMTRQAAEADYVVAYRCNFCGHWHRATQRAGRK